MRQMVVIFLYGGVAGAILLLWGFVSMQMVKHVMFDWLTFLAVQLTFGWYFWNLYGLYVQHKRDTERVDQEEKERIAHERGVALYKDAWQRETSTLANKMLLENAKRSMNM